jgi:nucleoside-diphosphate-sugar epimerase
VIAVDLQIGALQALQPNPHLHILKGDFTDHSLLGSYLSGHDICFHLASAHLEARLDQEHFWKINVQGARDFVEQCHRAGISRFVHCSSVGVFGDIKNPPADEESDCHPDIVYEQSKLAGEMAVKKYACEKGYAVVVLRPAWVYGPHCPRTLKLFKSIKKRRFFFVGDGCTLRHPIYIDDMVQAFEIAATYDQASGNVFIIAGPRAVTLLELVGEIAECLGTSPPTLKLPKFLVWPGCYFFELASAILRCEVPCTRRSLKFFTGNTAFTTRKAQELLGFQAQIELAEGLKRTCEWMKATQKI